MELIFVHYTDLGLLFSAWAAYFAIIWVAGHMLKYMRMG